MEILFEFLVELLLEGTIDLSKNKKIPKLIRYPLIIVIILLFLGVIFITIFTGVLAYQKINKLAGILLIIIGTLLLVGSILKFKKTYLIQKDNVKL